MKLTFRSRATAILFDVLRSLNDNRPFVIPANSCTVIPLTFLKAGTPFVVCDISPDNYCIDTSRVLELISDQPLSYAGLIYIHSYGVEDTPETFFSELRALAPHLMIIDDRCLCTPKFDPIEMTDANIVLFSTGYAKQVSIGFGGYAYMRDDLPFEPLPLVFNCASLKAIESQVKECMRDETPLHYKDSDWLDLRDLEIDFDSFRDMVRSELIAVEQHKSILNQIYVDHIPFSAQFPSAYQNWRFNVRVPHNQKLLASLFETGLFASSHYQSVGPIFVPNRFRVTESVHSETINLFNDRNFSSEMAIRAAECVKRHYKKYL